MIQSLRLPELTEASGSNITKDSRARRPPEAQQSTTPFLLNSNTSHNSPSRASPPLRPITLISQATKFSSPNSPAPTSQLTPPTQTNSPSLRGTRGTQVSASLATYANPRLAAAAISSSSSPTKSDSSNSNTKESTPLTPASSSFSPPLPPPKDTDTVLTTPALTDHTASQLYRQRPTPFRAALSPMPVGRAQPKLRHQPRLRLKTGGIGIEGVENVVTGGEEDGGFSPQSFKQRVLRTHRRNNNTLQRGGGGWVEIGFGGWFECGVGWRVEFVVVGLMLVNVSAKYRYNVNLGFGVVRWFCIRISVEGGNMMDGFKCIGMIGWLVLNWICLVVVR